MYKIESKRYNVVKYFHTMQEAQSELEFFKRFKLIQQNAVVKTVH